MGGGQLLTVIQKLKEGFSIRKLDTALEKQGAVLGWESVSEKERRVRAVPATDACASGP